MTRYRWIIFFLFAILFFATGTVLLFYAQGYRYHFGRKAIEKTGQLSVESKPKGASVKVNGQQSLDRWPFSVRERESRTPARIPGVLSGTYTVRLENEGYHPWTRVVTVEPGQASLIRAATLIRTSAAEEITSSLPEGASLITATPSRIVTATRNELTAFDVKTLQSRILLRTGEPLSHSVKIGKEESIFLANEKNAWLIGSDEKATPLILPREALVQFRWSQNNDRIIALTESRVVELSSRSKPRVLTTAPVFDALLHDSTLFFIPKTNPQEVRRKTLLGKGSREEIFFRSPSVLSRIIAAQGKRLIVAAAKNDLILGDDSTGRVSPIVLRAGKEARFWDDRTLISWNEFEVFQTDLSGASVVTPQLIVRTSVGIRKVELFPQIGYLAVLFGDGSLSLIEQTAAESRNRYSLADQSMEVLDITPLGEKGLARTRSQTGKVLMRLETVRLAE